MEDIEAAAVRRFIADALTLIADNDEALLSEINTAVRDAVVEGMGHGDNSPREAYAEMLAGRGSFERREYADVAGLAIRDVIWDALPDSETFGGLLLRDLLDYGDRQQWELIGDHYLPESVDDLPEDDDADADED